MQPCPYPFMDLRLRASVEVMDRHKGLLVLTSLSCQLALG